MQEKYAAQIVDVIKMLEDSYPDGPPSESRILSQTVEYRSADWIDNYPSQFAIPDFLLANEIGKVSRQQLFDQARTVSSPSDALSLFVHIMCWGHGKSASRKWQAFNAMKSPNAADILFESFCTIEDVGAVDTFRKHQRGKEFYLQDLGESFFTKWLYFSAYERWPGEKLAPLILDSRVAEALGWSSYRSPRRYEMFLEWAEEIQSKWAPENRTHVIEFSLFWLKNLKAKTG